MNRLVVIQSIIDKIKANNYLEIGVQHGKVLTKIKCENKVGVDPCFKLSNHKKIKNTLGISKFKAFPITSDEFFQKHAEKILKNGIDVAFVDGLHNYEQSFKDVENCLKYMNKNGVIIIHDCSPLSAAGAYPVKKSIDEMLELANKGDLPGWNGSWNGDVWKTLVHQRIIKSDLDIFTLNLDWGLGIITEGKNNKIKNCTVAELKDADYSFLEKNREELLNLKPPKYLYEYLDKKFS